MKSGLSFGVRYATGWHARYPETALRICSIGPRMCSGGRRQFMPTMSAPASNNAFAASAALLPSAVSSLFSKQIVTIAGNPVFLARSTAIKRFAQPGKRFADDEVHSFVDLHRKLLVECLAHPIGCRRTAGLVHPGQAQVARDQALIARDFARHAHRRAIQFFQVDSPVRRWPACRGWRRT